MAGMQECSLELLLLLVSVARRLTPASELRYWAELVAQDDVIAMVTNKTGGEEEDLELVETADRMLPVIWTEMIGDH